MKSDEIFAKHEKSKEIVSGLIKALHEKAAYHHLDGAAIVMGFQTDQIGYIDVGISDVIPIDEENGTDVLRGQAVIDYCKCCLKEIANGAEHFDPIDFDGRGTMVGCAVLKIEDQTFVVVVATDSSRCGIDHLLHLGNLFCPYRAWYGTYDCVICNYD